MRRNWVFWATAGAIGLRLKGMDLKTIYACRGLLVMHCWNLVEVDTHFLALSLDHIFPPCVEGITFSRDDLAKIVQRKGTPTKNGDI